MPRGRPAAKRNRNHLLFTVLGGIVVFTLIGSIIGPPIIDYLTKASDESSDTSSSNSTADPNEQQYRAEVAAHPDDPESLAALAGYLGQTGRVDEAIPYFEQALARAPDDWGIRLDFADALANGDKRADAELQYQKVIAAQPTNAIAIFSLGQLYQSWVPPRTRDAIAQYERVVQVGDGSYVKDLAEQALAQLGVASPVAGTPVASTVPAKETS
jgi:tetratricopeptide (TPR) repeat protein